MLTLWSKTEIVRAKKVLPNLLNPLIQVDF